MYYLAYIVLGIVQLAAICSYFTGVRGWSLLPGVIVALLTTYVPFLGSILGIIGAYKAWGWPLWGAILLFGWMIVIAIASLVSKN